MEPAREGLRQKLEYRTIKPAQRALQPWRYVTYGSIRVHHKRYLDGSGSAVKSASMEQRA